MRPFKLWSNSAAVLSRDCSLYKTKSTEDKKEAKQTYKNRDTVTVEDNVSKSSEMSNVLAPRLPVPSKEQVYSSAGLQIIRARENWRKLNLRECAYEQKKHQTVG